jgi:hypothetical protein
MNESCTRGDIGAAEIAIDFFVSLAGMEQGGGAVKKGDEGKSEWRVAIGRATKLSGEEALDEFERRHGLLAREGESPVFGDETQVVGMGGEEIEGAAASLDRGARGLNGGKKMTAGAAAEEHEEFTFVGEALVESGRSGARGASDGAHGESVLAAFAPKTISGVENAALQTGISNTRHGQPSRSELEELYPLQR